jgi:hypothetical protein
LHEDSFHQVVFPVHTSIASEESNSAMIALHPIDVESNSPSSIAISLVAATEDICGNGLHEAATNFPW